MYVCCHPLYDAQIAMGWSGVMNNSIPRRPRGLPAKRELEELAAGLLVNQASDGCDLIHVTPVGWGRRIVSSARIEARHCQIFGHDLVYTFLERPAYRFRDGDLKSDQVSRFPFVFILSSEHLGPPHHVYPFDTGAAVAGLYGKTADPTVYLEDYELSPTLIGALKHIAWGFGSNSAYFEGTLKADLAERLPNWNVVGRGWTAIAGLASVGHDRPDARAAAIEIAYRGHINLKQHHARLAIFPLQFIEDECGSNSEFLDQLKALNLTYKTYNWRPNETPDSFMDEVTRIVREHLEEIGQL